MGCRDRHPVDRVAHAPEMAMTPGTPGLRGWIVLAIWAAALLSYSSFGLS
jgi:hypothetical protein